MKQWENIGYGLKKRNANTIRMAKKEAAIYCILQLSTLTNDEEEGPAFCGSISAKGIRAKT
jgi:hypothetical protein